MVDSGVATMWADAPWWLNHDGEPVEREEEAYGRKTKYELVHPEKLILLSQQPSKNLIGIQGLYSPIQMDSLSYVQLHWHIKYSSWSM